MIRLTGEEQLKALDVVRRRALDNDVTPDRAQEDSALCEAQVKKFAEWLEKNTVPAYGGNRIILSEVWNIIQKEMK